LTDTSTVVDVYINSGMPANKICIGAAIYGRGWSGVPADNNGLFQSFASVPQGTWDDGTSGATGVFDYKDVMERLRSGQATRFWDSEVHAAWLYGADGTMISYDDVQSVTDKCNFVNDKQLAGIMVWELSGDDQSDSLVSTIFQGLSGGGGGGDGGSPPPPSDPNPPPPSDPNPPPSNDPPGTHVD
jgi:chitinase